MNNKKKSIRLNPAEKGILIKLYLDRRLAIEPYQNRPKDLRELTNSFNAMTDRSDPPEDILHYMRTQRKRGKWPKLGSTALQVSTPIEEILTDEERKMLESIYISLGQTFGKGNDSFAHEPELMRELEKGFLNATGRYVYGSQLLAALTDMRKAGNLETLNLKKHGHREAFGDMSEAENM